MRYAFAFALVFLLAAALAAQQPSPCQQEVWSLAAQSQFRTAANALALCSGANSEADLTLLAQLAQISHALDQSDWPGAAVAMQALAVSEPQTLPATLDSTLAPAFLRFGAGSPTDAALLARAPTRRHAAAALPFQAFLRHEYARSLWRRFALPGIVLFLAVLIVSFALGLRRTLAAV